MISGWRLSVIFRQQQNSEAVLSLLLLLLLRKHLALFVLLLLLLAGVTKANQSHTDLSESGFPDVVPGC